jgi:hypothetical protein|tara:strand:+ start:5885 stop:6034 length:150 start_codon:yes stop_codon:yes gene_type:complete
MINWINSWKGGNKKEKYQVCLRFGKLTFLEITVKSKKLRFIIFNFGFEI